ncbi:ABC transporter substrate-binding protein [Halococcoides cellulosivorans]|uniref:ABC transporter substrate-binding protein n=1 Tax=Halococcoides cellulosivorans TaxID=1679096 RepID=A0A2R4WZA2_9EURY|nr:ABC transporter substrate-binding protein [Halococcoides cellulosivorans]AWB26867.1 ABC transporter substrate-binding protein [Halococcoides cellulosivorans]
MASSASDEARSHHRVELVHRLAGGDGRAALEAFLAGIDDVRVETTLVDDVGLTVKTRLLREEAPDCWIGWPGRTLEPYVQAGMLADAGPVWTDDVRAAYREGPREAARIDGVFRAVPITIHRINNLFFHPDPVDRAGVDLERVDSPAALIDALERIDEAVEAHPIAFPMKNPWTVLQAWETILVALAGASGYREILDGRVRDHRDAVERALDIVARLADLAAPDALYSSLTRANDRFIEGSAVTITQGDWVAGQYVDRADMEYGTDWDHVAVPGTGDAYVMNMDAVVATAAEDRDLDAVHALLAYAASVDGQRRFNQKKGSIPPRSDVSMDAFGPFRQDQARAFDAARSQPVSLTHGLGVSPTRLVECKTAMAAFVAERDVGATTTALVDALAD